MATESPSPAERHSCATVAAEQFLADAKAARETTLASGLGYAANEVHAYVRDRIAGRRTSEPKPFKWRG